MLIESMIANTQRRFPNSYDSVMVHFIRRSRITTRIECDIPVTRYTHRANALHGA